MDRKRNLSAVSSGSVETKLSKDKTKPVKTARHDKNQDLKPDDNLTNIDEA